ncbi:MAG: hypothetical protein CRN43_04885 [Candidatus Nephrothrix sp. EaCA]|nr:MAG: hypothetical protein CRN43_04885 [Candidatus Nephrothrix sp. EaCA]
MESTPPLTASRIGLPSQDANAQQLSRNRRKRLCINKSKKNPIGSPLFYIFRVEQIQEKCGNEKD